MIFYLFSSCKNESKPIHPRTKLLTEISDSNFHQYLVEEKPFQLFGDSIPYSILKLQKLIKNDTHYLEFKKAHENPLIILDFSTDCNCIHMNTPTKLFEKDQLLDSIEIDFMLEKDALPDFAILKLFANTKALKSIITLDLRKIK